MAFPLLLPLLLGGADPQIIATGDHQRVEQALSDGVRKRVEDGYVVIDVRTANDELVVTLAKGETFERHVVKFDASNTYRVEADTPALPDPEEPGSFLGVALAAPAGGGFEIESSCGDYYLKPYVVDEHATGEFAGELIARSLATADNLTYATPTNDKSKITFGLQKKNVGKDLVVWLDRKGSPIEAQLRRYEYQGGGAVYKRMGAMKKSLAKTRVITVQGTTLILPKGGKFVLDPSGEAFGYDDDGDHGCGC